MIWRAPFVDLLMLTSVDLRGVTSDTDFVRAEYQGFRVKIHTPLLCNVRQFSALMQQCYYCYCSNGSPDVEEAIPIEGYVQKTEMDEGIIL